MKLLCHETIPGTGYNRGDVVHDAAEVERIQSHELLSKHFSRVADEKFPLPVAPTPSKVAVVSAPANNATSPVTQASASN